MVAVRFNIGKAKAYGPPEGFIPNPKLKLLDQLTEVMRFKHLGELSGIEGSQRPQRLPTVLTKTKSLGLLACPSLDQPTAAPHIPATLHQKNRIMGDRIMDNPRRYPRGGQATNEATHSGNRFFQ